MVQLADESLAPAPQPSTGTPSTPPHVSDDNMFSAGLNESPPAEAVHTYDRERDTATTRFTLDYPGGLVVTTTVEVRLRHPNGYSVSVSNPANHEGARVPTATVPPLPAYHVPLPTSFVRPDNEAQIRRYYVVYVGKEVGVFTGEFEATVAPLVKGIRHNKVEGFSTFDDAVYQYTRAYQGLRLGCPVRVVGSIRPVQVNNTYDWGTGQMLGTVDITGLDIDPALVSNVS
ncbi:hypothetical protein V5O48_013471 [Marasmius crinis-equi]|uniref:Uncharacterized protein n=1 Tax=Marasmius crinis-equi TaxID=585013 RepID=A0ABR3EZZ5_9AGAR